MDNGSSPVLLSVRNLRKYFPIRGGLFSQHIGDVRAVDGVSFDIHEAETVGLVGESGCGKTTVGRLILRLLDPTSGHTFYRPDGAVMGRLNALYGTLESLRGGPDGEVPSSPEALSALREIDTIARTYSLYRKSSGAMHKLRGKLQIVFQDPFSSLSPRMLVRDVVGEPLTIHHIGTRAQRYQRVAELMTAVGLNPDHLWRFPHEFSGGQRQRIGIARALAMRPDFIVLDEPTSALDVSVQAQILNILRRLQSEQRLAYLFISHHLSVVRAMSRKVVVMYLGQVVEWAPTEDLFSRPLHPYTQALLAAIPVPDPTLHRERIILKGDVPSPAAPPSGCRFHTRCPAVMPICPKVEPRLLEVRPGHFAACHLYPGQPSLGPGAATNAPSAALPSSAGALSTPFPGTAPSLVPEGPGAGR
ncbi:MAG: ABC transporter ATP-binding protein [Thermoplasmata archaeon]|nr:ABC transporter ATP-binding protein [Thermoplasmata archaeon]MCI4359163.1 ABC transporter ATP-binding protein [Thermoplasmata archaeon]